MAQLERLSMIVAFCGLSLWISGCGTSSSPPPKPAGNSPAATQAGNSPATNESGGADGLTVKPSGTWSDYPDVPKFEIMTEVNGIKIPRQAKDGQRLQLTGKIAADVSNEHAAKTASEPVTGDTLTIRFPSEPKVLNPITDPSAATTYILRNVLEGFAKQNMETFQFEPLIASKWLVEDSIKLSADYPGQERRVATEGGNPAASIEIEYAEPAQNPEGKPAEPPTITLSTTNKEGQPTGNVWVGLFPVGKIVGAPVSGYHFWSGPDGKAHVSGLRSGKYTAKVGAEIYGKTQKGTDGSVIVTPATEENPLHETIKSSGETSLTLKAGEWSDIQEQTYLTHYLRDDVKWSDGTPFTTKDMEFAYAVVMNHDVDADHLRPYFIDLIECRALAPRVLRMRYRQQYFKSMEIASEFGTIAPPFHFFANLFKETGRELTLDKLTPDEEKAQKKVSVHGQEFGKFFNTDSRYNQAPLGTGPYIVDKWQSKDRIELVRNPNYWNTEHAGHLDRIIIKFIPDQVSAMAALKAGEIDFFYDMSPEQYFEDWPNIDKKRRDDYVQASWYSPAFSYFGWNLLSPYFQDRRVRIALTLLFDRQDFVDTKLHGAGAVVSGSQYYFGPGYDRDVAPLAYDPETAKELLADAGWVDTDNDGILDRDGKKFQIELFLAQGKPINLQRCEVLQKNLKAAGIDLQIKPLEWASFIEKVRAKACDVITVSWATPVESDPFQIWHSSGAGRESRGSNHVSFANPEADALIDMLRMTLDEKKRERIHQSFHRLIDAEQPYLFLWIPKEFGAYHKRFRNVKWYRLRPGFDLAEWYVPKDEQLHK